MKFRTRSFEVRAPSPAQLVGLLAARAPRLASGALGLIFCTREASGKARELALALGAHSAGTWVVVAGQSVSSERGEVEGEVAATGIVLAGADTQVVVRDSADPDFGAELGRALTSRQGASALTLLRADQLDEDWMSALHDTAPEGQARVYGGGTCPEVPLLVAEADRVRAVRAVAVVVDRSRPAQVAASAACRLISPLQRVTATEGPILLTLDHLPALTALGEAANELRDQSPILVAQAEAKGALGHDGRALALKPLAGIDPARGALVLTTEIPVGARVAFAVRDARAGKQDFEAHLRGLLQGSRGAAPDFGILVSCSGRGKALFGPNMTDARMVGQRFPDLPFAGFSSYFELGALDGRLTSQIYSGLFGLYCRPS
jgi:small ligand-binding sensory domain FIST